MTKYAKLSDDGLVGAILVGTACYDPDMIEVPDTVGPGWRLDGDEWLAPEIVAEPRPLTRLEFIRLGQTAGGMTDAQLVAARQDLLLAAMWIKLDLATQIERDDPDAQAAIAALDAMDYLPQGAAAVLAAWPTR